MTDHELTSRLLDEQELGQLVECLPTILCDLLGDTIVICQYGALSKVHPNLWYVPLDVGLKWLDRFLRESVEQRIFQPGGSDLHIATREGTMDVRVCHEGDIHLSGSDPALVRRFMDHPAVSPFFC